MAVILQTTLSDQIHFLERMLLYLDSNVTKFVPKSRNNNKPILVVVQSSPKAII